MKAIIDECPRHAELVFSSTGGLLTGHGKAKTKLDILITKERLKRGANSQMAPWVLHDFRRSLSTHMHERLGIEPQVIEAILNHVSGTKAGVAGVYNRAEYLGARRDAFEAWERLIDIRQEGNCRENSNGEAV